MKNAKNIIKSLASDTPSKWREKAQWRRDNRAWLRKSQTIALNIIEAMKDMGLSQKDLAEKMSVSPQHISKVLKGSENLTLEKITKFEVALGIELQDIKIYSKAPEIVIDTPRISNWVRPTFANTPICKSTYTSNGQYANITQFRHNQQIQPS